MFSLRELFGENKCADNILIHKNIKKTVPWIEKYRPKKLKDIIHQTEIAEILNKVISTGNLQHMIFYGPPGSGKTSMALAIARELFGSAKDRTLELNASDSRGINVVRTQIMNFAKLTVGVGDPNCMSLPYKMIILDEADAMTPDAQSALRKIIEDYSHITRFCFICNYIVKIMEPIKSRCVKLRFKSISSESMITRLTYIAKKEKLKIKKNIIKKIAEIAKGDMRAAIMILQNLKYISQSTKISISVVCDISGCVPDNIIDTFAKVCLSCDNNFNKTISCVKHIISLGYPVDNIIEKLQYKIIYNKKLSDIDKAIISMQFSKIKKRLIKNGNDYLQLLSIAMCIKNVIIQLI